MININKITVLKNKSSCLASIQRRSAIFNSTAIALVLSACGRETRSTTEVPLKDETSNNPTAFDDKLIGSDDADTFTALAGNDEKASQTQIKQTQ